MVINIEMFGDSSQDKLKYEKVIYDIKSQDIMQRCIPDKDILHHGI
jgi:hypothetical protein